MWGRASSRKLAKSEVKAAAAQIDTLSKALDQYRLDTGHYPGNEQGLMALWTKPADETRWWGPYLRKAPPKDPWGRDYVYKSPGEHGDFDLYSLGKDGREGAMVKTRTSPIGKAFPRRLFCQELAVLLDAGIPFVRVLADLARRKRLRRTRPRCWPALTQALSEGKTLSQAMRMVPGAFSPLLIASIEASQRTGQTAQALRQHAAYLAWLGGLRDKLVSAAIYPAILIGASFPGHQLPDRVCGAPLC